MDSGNSYDLYASAIDVAIQAGAIKECEYHSGTYLDCEDEEANSNAYAIGTNLIKNNQVDYDRKDFMDAIKGAIDEGGMQCYSCEKLENE